LHRLELLYCNKSSRLLWKTGLSVAVCVSVCPSHSDVSKLAKYSELASDDMFQPTAVENLGSFDSATCQAFFSNLDNKTRASSGDDKEKEKVQS